MTVHDTIFACSSGAPPAAIAIVRISGPAAFAIAFAMAGPLPPPRRATVRAVRSPGDGSLLDRALMLTFPAPKTTTGEDIVEFHLHGGRAVVAAVEAALATHAATRRAEPGEFTRRALANGVIDLTAAEGLGDLLAAETETQRRAALRMAEGGLRMRVDAWTDRLIAIAARIEAQLDFSDEDDVPVEAEATLMADVARLADEIAAVLSTPPVERLHDGVRVVIAGPPNSGKSTLLNAFTGRDVAIVSPISGTTRDRIEATVSRAGIAYILTDTAGLTDTPGDAIERIGVERAGEAVAGADIVVWLGDTAPQGSAHIWVHARADVEARAATPIGPYLAISAKTGFGMAELWQLIDLRAATLLPQEGAVATNQRQRSLLADCVESLSYGQETDLLIVAEHLRRGLRALDAVAGRSGTEDVLDAIFARFCIGK